MSRRSWFAPIMLLALLVALGALALLDGPGAAPMPVHAASAVCTPVVTRISSPNQGVYANRLVAVSALAPDDVWALGHYLDDNSFDQLLLQHWDGATWQIMPSPTFAPGSIPDYNALAAIARDDIWVVGEAPRPPFTAALHWAGQTWSQVPMPALPAVGTTALTSVARVAPNDVWAAGYYSPEANKVNTLLEHWDGTAWTIIPSPNA